MSGVRVISFSLAPLKMHAPFRQPDESQLHQTWRGGANGQHYFNSDYARQLIETFNRCGDMQAINELLKHVEPLAKSILEYRNTTQHASVDELLSRIRIKLWRSLRLYDAERGTAFSFVARIIQSISYSAVSDAWNRSERFCELNGENYYHPCGADSAQMVADIESRVRSIKTPCTDLDELEAQRWFANSFLDCEFHIRRHQAANCAMQVFRLDYVRSRWLFDLTLLSIRRELIADRRLTPISPGSLECAG